MTGSNYKIRLAFARTSSTGIGDLASVVHVGHLLVGEILHN